jgi:branched-chain amino acid transport system substrate-binding protein
MRQSREVGLSPQAFLGGGAGFDTSQFEGEKDISTNIFSVTQWTPDSSPSAAAFAARYQAKYGKAPTYHAACTYTSMMVVGAAVKAAGDDRAKIRDALASGSWQTIMGTVKYLSFEGFTNQNQVAMPVVQYQAGGKVTVFPPAAAKAKAVYPFPGWK